MKKTLTVELNEETLAILKKLADDLNLTIEEYIALNLETSMKMVEAMQSAMTGALDPKKGMRF